ncbi:MAG TPA: hypothetical protein VGG11_17465 [Xanthobacteraceae bacterium]
MERGYASLTETIDRVAAMPNGRPLAEVLKLVQKDTDSTKVRVSPDLHRATLEPPEGGLIAVRVTVARQPYAHGPWHFRFKSPTDAKQFRALYFGGLNQRGTAAVHKLTAAEIGSKKTITLAAQ